MTIEDTYQPNYEKNTLETYQDSYTDSYKQDSFPDSYKQDSFPDSYKQDSFPDSYKQDSFLESYKQDSYADSNKQDSFPDSYKQDSFPDSYADSYKDENYTEDNNPNQYDYNIPDATPATSVYEYDNKYPISNSYPEESVSIQENYETGICQQEKDFMDYETPYNKHEEVDSYEYEDSYQDSYQDSYEDSGKRLSEVPELSVTTPKGQTRTNGYQSSESEYFYPTQDESELRRKKLIMRDSLMQQNTDSLESRDDEFKDSFETAVSSVGSSQPRKGFSEYSTAGESTPIPTSIVESPLVANHIDGVPTSITTTAMVHGGMSNGKRPLARTESYVEDVEDEEFIENFTAEMQRKDSQLSHQSQINGHEGIEKKNKLIRGESYASEDGYGGGRRESFRRDSYGSGRDEFNKNGTALGRTDSYQKRELTRGSSVYGQNYATPQPISRAESYQRGYFKDQDSIDETEIVLSNAINGEYKMRDETLER